jgi:hypothetical protein
MNYSQSVWNFVVFVHTAIIYSGEVNLCVCVCVCVCAQSEEMSTLIVAFQNRIK